MKAKKAKRMTQIISALVIPFALVVSGSAQAGKFDMEGKLKQCEIAFNKAHSGEMSQVQAAKARTEHMKLVLEILENLNKRNTAVALDTGEALSQEAIVNNFRVMGRLLEMMAADHRPATTEWNYAY